MLLRSLPKSPESSDCAEKPPRTLPPAAVRRGWRAGCTFCSTHGRGGADCTETLQLPHLGAAVPQDESFWFSGLALSHFIPHCGAERGGGGVNKQTFKLWSFILMQCHKPDYTPVINLTLFWLFNHCGSSNSLY
ncbi:hypothetical protein FKM82_020977 [Ascaphus truei]